MSSTSAKRASRSFMVEREERVGKGGNPQKMEEKFETKDWERLVIDMNLSRETAFNWLGELQRIGMIKKVKHGHYMKTEMKILRNVE